MLGFLFHILIFVGRRFVGSSGRRVVVVVVAEFTLSARWQRTSPRCAFAKRNSAAGRHKSAKKANESEVGGR